MVKGKRSVGAIMLLMTIVCMMGIGGCGENQESQEAYISDQNSEENGEEILVVERDGYIRIETPYCVLEYPGEWKDYLGYEKKSGDNVLSIIISCKLKDQSVGLFKISFGEQDEGDLIGYLKAGDEQTGVYIETYELTIDNSITEDEKEIVYAMAETVNDIIQSVKNNEYFIGNIAEDAGVYGKETESIKIETSYCTLEYPAYWADYLKYEGKEENGIFSEDFFCTIGDRETKLFTVYFGEQEIGVVIGYVTKDGEKYICSVESMDINLDDTWTDAEKDTIYKMSECINYVIDSVVSCGQYSAE